MPKKLFIQHDFNCSYKNVTNRRIMYMNISLFYKYNNLIISALVLATLFLYMTFINKKKTYPEIGMSR